jgi:hypothetical protein
VADATAALSALAISSDPGSSSSSNSGATPDSSSDRSYFDQYYPDFVHDPTAKFIVNFRALAQRMGWRKEFTKAERIRAMLIEFEILFSGETGDLAKWQELCRVVGVKTEPASIKKCKKVPHPNLPLPHDS